jgi:hypothetical protein
MLNQNYGMAVGWGGTLLKTTDGGDTWQSQTISDMNFWVSSYMDSSNIFLGGSTYSYGYILRSQNAGLSWDTVYQVLYKSPYTICRLGEQSLIVSMSDGLIIKSTDMGSSWISLNSPRQYHCYTSFIDSLNGLLCFMDGYIYRTTNGGNSWISEWPFSYSDLKDIQMLNIEDAVAVGTNGSIISTITDHIVSVDYSNIIDLNTSSVNYRLLQNYPNPFNPTTTINYEMLTAGKVKLVVYDLLGSEVKVLVDEEKSAGRYEVTFDGSKLSSGIYFYQLKAGEFSETRKMVLLK